MKFLPGMFSAGSTAMRVALGPHWVLIVYFFFIFFILEYWGKVAPFFIFYPCFRLMACYVDVRGGSLSLLLSPPPRSPSFPSSNQPS